MFHLLALPFKLFFGLVFGVLFLSFGLLILPFLLLKFVIKAMVLLIALPFALLAIGAALLVAFIAVLCVMMIPLLPFAFVALCIWAIVQASRPAYSPQPSALRYAKLSGCQRNPRFVIRWITPS